MALTAVRPAMNHDGTPSLHPFFSKAPRDTGHHEPTEEAPPPETLIDDARDDLDYGPASRGAQPAKTRKKRTRKGDPGKGQASLEQFARPSRAQPADEPATENATHANLEEDPNQERRKRRKTESPVPAESLSIASPSLDWHQQLQLQAGASEPDVEDTEPIDKNTSALLRAVSPARIATAPDSVDMEIAPKPTPKKQIRVTKSGKLVSSPPKPSAESPATPKKRRGRKPAQAKIPPTVTIIKYGSDPTSKHAIGGKIEAILNSKSTKSKKSTTPKKATTPKKRSTKAVQPPKSTHPFFAGKAGEKADAVQSKPPVNQRPPTPRKSAVTPGKLRAEAQRDRSDGPMPTFGLALGPSRASKQSGLLEPSWPSRETVHVRNLAVDSSHQAAQGVVSVLPLRVRKLKNRIIHVGVEEDLILKLARDLEPHIRTPSRDTDFDFASPEDVRLPTRLLTTGMDIQKRVMKELQERCRLGEQQQNATLHPAVSSLFNDIEHTLTPFDEGRCEGQTWAQKYSPKCASAVLQEGGEAKVLKDWLQSLTVLAVGGGQSLATARPSDSKKPPRKKRKKEVDDFIVSDDEDEEEEMVELSDCAAPAHLRSLQRPRWTRNNNVVIISGPHGCGKSAAVYAVAKELDFEVFEINSGSRRSGKDIQDKVGDMTANHLVNHKRPNAPPKEDQVAADDIENERASAALQKDIDSGRQGTMMTFFKSAPATKTTPRAKVKPKVTKQAPKATEQAVLPLVESSRKSQKQSLILFEEADILFDEDQPFWIQVSKLAAQSKRPIIITCSDESPIPLGDLPLAAILRLQPSPVELATDYMLALAGREGHILQRQAVKDLYQAKHHDLRASITELDFWCQMSVGDRKGGLEWLYQRWPPGKDVDATGRLLRVASEDTYQSGMGFLSHNVFETRSNAIFDKEEELLTEVWSDWGISPSDRKITSPQSAPPQSDLIQSLEDLDAFMESLSAGDIYSRIDLPSYAREHDQPIDPTLPSMPDKARLSYTLAAPLLQVDAQADFSQFDTSIYTQTHLLARRAFPAISSLDAPCELSTETSYAKAILARKEDKRTDNFLSRPDFSTAFDLLAALPDQTLPERTSFYLIPSSFDRTFSVITTDLAPYVRSIVAHEQILEAQRVRLSSLLSAGGNGKRARTTRASRVALEGGVRETKRRDRWFDKHLNFELVMGTAGKGWAGMGWRGDESEDEEGTGSGSVTGTQDSPAASQDVVMCGTDDE